MPENLFLIKNYKIIDKITICYIAVNPLLNRPFHYTVAAAGPLARMGGGPGPRRKYETIYKRYIDKYIKKY